MTSADEYSVDGSRKAKLKARFQANDYGSDGNVMDQRTIASIDHLDPGNKKKGGFGGYNFARTASNGFNSGTNTSMPSATTAGNGANQMQALQMQ